MTKVLIVNEDGTHFDRFKPAFDSDGGDFELLQAISGPRALGMASSQKPDVVVVDGEMVGLDGYSFTQQLKADDSASGAKVIILTEKPSEASSLKARQVGASAHLPESIDASALVAKVKTLARNETEQAPAEAQPEMETQAVAETETKTGTETRQVPVPPDEGYGVPQPVEQTRSESYGTPGPSPASAFVPSVRDRSGPGAEVPHVDDLLRIMVERGGSDLHITVGSQPGVRLRGELLPLEDYKILTNKDSQAMLLSLLSEEQRRRFETELELDFAYSLPGVSRFRANVFQQRNSMGAVFRTIPIRIPTLEELRLPKVCRYLAERPRGLVLVTGPTGAGKSTTQAAMIDHINDTRHSHIITIEDPIEFLHQNKKCYINQREVGEDTHSFAAALKRVLRQDPDVILVGEMRDLETISTAITAAETGHLVLATLHTTGGPATVDRIIDVFPPHQQQQVRMQLSNTLEGVLSQVLLRSTDGRSRVLAMEVMLGIPAIRNLIREGKTHQMATIIQGGAQVGMQTLDQHLKTLLQAGRITYEEAISKAQNPKELAQMMGRKV